MTPGRPENSRVRRGPQAGLPAGQAGFSLPEVMVVLAIIMLLATMAIPRARQAKQRAQEAAAVETLRATHTGQEAQRILTGSYAPSFKALTGEGGAPIVPGGADTQDSGGGESVLIYQGYIFRLRRTAPDEYTVTAEPVEDRDSRPHYAMDQTGSVTGGGGSMGSGPGIGTPGDKDKKK